MRSVDDYHIGVRPRPYGPPIPFDEWRRRHNELDSPGAIYVKKTVAEGTAFYVKTHDIGVARERGILRMWKRYLGNLAGMSRCACGDIAYACGGPDPNNCLNGGIPGRST